MSNEIRNCILPDFDDVKYYNIDIINKELLFDVLEKICFSHVFHLAARTRIQPSFVNPMCYFNTNINGTLHLVEYCSKNNIPITYAGSSSHHSGKMKNPYTFTKDVGEEILTLYNTHFKLKSNVARFYNVYGPNQLLKGEYSTLIGKWINNYNTHVPFEIFGDGTKRRDFTHVDDICSALILIMNKKIFNVNFELGRGKNYSINEVAGMFGILDDVIYKQDKPGEAIDTLCKSNLAKKLLGWAPRKNLKDYIEQEIENLKTKL